MNSSYLWGEDEEWGGRYYFAYYSQFGNRKGISTVEVVILAISFVLAVGGNLGMAGCIIGYKELRTPTNMCLVNLATADLLFSLGVPAIAYTRFTQSWRLGETICRLLPYTQFVCGFVLLWTLTFISMDRHRCLAVAPYRSALTKVKVLTASLITWIIAVVAFLPIVFWFQQKDLKNGSTICTLIFPRSEIANVSLCYTIPIIILACFLPMILLVYHYQRIFKKIFDSRSRWAVPCVAQGLESGATGRRDSELSVVGTLLPWTGRKQSCTSITGRKGRTGSLSQHEEIRLHKHLRVVRILLLNVVAVLVMWLPITIVMLLIYMDGKRPNEDTNFFLRSHHFVWTLTAAQLNTIVNPLLYGVFSENFRVYFAKLWKRKIDNNSKSVEQLAPKKSSKSLEIFQTRSGEIRTPHKLKSSNKRLQKNSSCSIGSIVEVPNSEKL
ncbi:free fatty acid receptor 4-like [Osmia bicornis bicornis]|uniref:free fatty acid receptor 4-like n=1 Tax=Osmia bicornis bicornis TaxID=1437191 RepID=UPI0010F9AFFC|nr:free fatty acid receptor 4-like [Osmia bicornis bicornis]XP_046143241.1 free fatty acid receptor 4-like [Osmia bicornis bicornis]XP_046143242.1 free fatty acid receptor 4-like [Osmia bicornis bicornis]XP_046143243.1 free fatty acid receptor 4-like [Osmia bicornis bicornis]